MAACSTGSTRSSSRRRSCTSTSWSLAPSADGPTRVALLGSTGSIGRQALDVLDALGTVFQVVAMAAGRDATTFAGQVASVRPRVVTLTDPAALAGLELPAGTIADRDPEAMLAMA